MTDCWVFEHLSIMKRFELGSRFASGGFELLLGVPTIIYLILYTRLCQHLSCTLLRFPIEEPSHSTPFRELRFGIMRRHLRVLPPAYGLHIDRSRQPPLYYQSAEPS